MARRHEHHHEAAWSSTALFVVLALVGLLIFSIWRSGLLVVRPDIAELRMPDMAPPALPDPNPEPLPAPVPRPG